LDSLISLILEKGYEAISITDITEHANVGRSTFYAHFENKEQLLFSGHDSLTQLLHHAQHPDSRLKNQELFSLLFQHISENYELAKAMMGKGGGDLMMGRMDEILKDYFLQQMRKKLSSEKDQRLFAQSFSSAIQGLISAWLEMEMPYKNADMSEKATQIFHSFQEIAKV